MAFSLGWNFRQSLAFVTDQSFACFVGTGTAIYPNTFTNGDGYSINAGFVTATWDGDDDRVNTNDPRIAGYQYQANDGTTTRYFRADLSSGSAPGAGTYNVDIALGLPDQALTQVGQVYDDTASVLDLTNGGSGYARAANHYVDATGADVTATTTWTGTTVPIAFATTTVNLRTGHINCGSVTTLAHFRLTLASAQSAVPVLMAQYRRRRG